MPVDMQYREIGSGRKIAARVPEDRPALPAARDQCTIYQMVC